MRFDLKDGGVDVDITQDGARNVVFDIVGQAQSDFGPLRITSLKNLFHEKGYDITRLRLDWVQYYIDDGLFAELLWEGEDEEHKHILKTVTTDVCTCPLVTTAT